MHGARCLFLPLLHQTLKGGKPYKVPLVSDIGTYTSLLFFIVEHLNKKKKKAFLFKRC
jgi:hypothetical protein